MVAEGYGEPMNVSNYNLGFNYIYQYKDHLEGPPLPRDSYRVIIKKSALLNRPHQRGQLRFRV